MVVAATGRELRAVLKGLGYAGEVPAQGGILEAELRGRRVALLATGVGPVNAGLALGRALALHEPELVLNLGVCGSFDMQRAPLLARILVRREIWPEYGLLGPECTVAADPRSIGLAQGCINDDQVWDRVDLAGPEALEKAGLGVPGNLIQGASLTVAGVTGTRERAEALRREYGEPVENPAGVSAENQAGVLAENMEGFAVAYGCGVQGIPCVELRTVSNQVGERGREYWDLNGALKALGALAEELFTPAT